MSKFSVLSSYFVLVGSALLVRVLFYYFIRGFSFDEKPRPFAYWLLLIDAVAFSLAWFWWKKGGLDLTKRAYFKAILIGSTIAIITFFSAGMVLLLDPRDKNLPQTVVFVAILAIFYYLLVGVFGSWVICSISHSIQKVILENRKA